MQHKVESVTKNKYGAVVKTEDKEEIKKILNVMLF